MGERVLRYLTMHISELDTPVPVVDYDIARRNIRRLQEYCDAHQFKLRPHIKTHKLPLFAHEQCKAGAVGITVQKVGEAEIMAQTGLTDILITYNVMGQEKAERLAHLTNFARISVAIDNDKALQSLVWAGSRASAPIGVLIEFESGGNRQGVQTPGHGGRLSQGGPEPLRGGVYRADDVSNHSEDSRVPPEDIAAFSQCGDRSLGGLRRWNTECLSDA